MSVIVLGVLVSTALFFWYTLDYYNGFSNALAFIQTQVSYEVSPVMCMASISLCSIGVSLLAFPLVIIAILINLYVRFQKTGSIKKKHSEE
jgi:hypothetical protein